MSNTHQQLASFVWSVADLLRGDYKRSEYGKVILPFTVLRRLDCVLAPTKEAVLKRKEDLERKGIKNTDKLLRRASRRDFYNTSRLDIRGLLGDQDRVAANLRSYLGAFSANAQEIFESYDFYKQIERLDNADLLYQVVGKFAGIDLSPERVDNHQMGYVFEELIRRFSEISNETAGEHFTPREVIKLMVNLLLAPDEQDLLTPGIVRTVLDPACGTGGMLSAAEDFILDHNPDATVLVFGQELNPESYAICRSDLMIKGQKAENIKFGNSFSHDRHYGQRFHYLLAKPAVRRRVEEGQGRRRGRAREPRVLRPLRRGSSPHQRRLAALPAAHDPPHDRARRGRQSARDRLQRLAAVHRRRRLR